MTEIKTSVAKVVIMGVDDEGNYISLLVDEKGQLKLAADVDLEWPSGNDALLKNKTITDIISGGKLKILNDLSGYATETTLAEIKAKTDNIPSDPAKESGVLSSLKYVTGTKVSGATDPTFQWANSDVQYTQKTATITKPTNVVPNYRLNIYNPSTETDIILKVFDVKTIGGNSRDALITTVVIPKAQTETGTSINTRTVYLNGVFVNADLKLVAANGTALSGSGGFTATLNIEEVI